MVVRRDGSDSELTVDPTPFTVVLATNPRHKAGTRLLIVYEGSCVDAVVEPWAEAELDIKEGSRHNLKVEGKHMSGWVTFTTKDGENNFSLREETTAEVAEGKRPREGYRLRMGWTSLAAKAAQMPYPPGRSPPRQDSPQGAAHRP